MVGSREGEPRMRKRWQRQRRPTQENAGGKWYLRGFSTSPGGTNLMAGKYSVGAVESQETGTDGGVAGSEAGQEQRGGDRDVRVDAQWRASEEGWRRQWMGEKLRGTGRHGKGRVDSAEAQM